MDTEQLKDKLIELLLEHNNRIKDIASLERELETLIRENKNLRQGVKELEKKLIDAGFML